MCSMVSTAGVLSHNTGDEVLFPDYRHGLCWLALRFLAAFLDARSAFCL